MLYDEKITPPCAAATAKFRPCAHTALMSGTIDSGPPRPQLWNRSNTLFPASPIVPAVTSCPVGEITTPCTAIADSGGITIAHPVPSKCQTYSFVSALSDSDWTTNTFV